MTDIISYTLDNSNRTAVVSSIFLNGTITLLFKSLDLKMMDYLEYLFINFEEDLLHFKHFLPIHLLEYVSITTQTFDVNDYKDYSCGYKWIRNEKYHLNDDVCLKFNKINHVNFQRFIDVNKKLLEQKSEINYYRYIFLNGMFSLVSEKKDKFITYCKTDIIYKEYHKFIEYNSKT